MNIVDLDPPPEAGHLLVEPLLLKDDVVVPGPEGLGLLAVVLHVLHGRIHLLHPVAVLLPGDVQLVQQPVGVLLHVPAVAWEGEGLVAGRGDAVAPGQRGARAWPGGQARLGQGWGSG